MQRSLLQTSHHRRRLYFRQLLRKFFLSKPEPDGETGYLKVFESWFEIYVANILYYIINDYNEMKLTRLDEERHNIKHMFTLFNTTSNFRITFSAIRSALQVIELEILQLRFQPMEIHDMSQKMLDSLDSFPPSEQAKMKSFFGIYVRVVCLVAKQQQSVQIADAIKTMDLRKDKIDKGYQKNGITVDRFTGFYNQLTPYYKDNGKISKATWCHIHILHTIHGQLKQCMPNCDYLNISIAYEMIKNREQAFIFRELAYKHQIHSLGFMQRAMLTLDLYFDYMNPSVGNNEIKANSLSKNITNEVYPYLISTDECDDTPHYAAVEFFSSKNMENQVFLVQQK